MEVRKEYQKQLQTLHDELTQMGNMCAQAMQLAVQAVTTGNQKLIERTLEADDIVDKKERDIENLCLKLLLQQQPVASDLRRISSALKMISDLERIGDQAADIAEISRYVVIQKGDTASDLHNMAAEVIKMVNDSVTAFIHDDLNLAQEVIAWDDTVDAWFVRIKDDLIAEIAADKSQGDYYLELLMVAKYLERIGDHATNVAEWVEYSILGHRRKNGTLPASPADPEA